MTTTPELPGARVGEVLGLVSGSCVMSRNVFSDLGSNMKSAFGGTLGGIETVIENARVEAQTRLDQAARALGADAIIGVDMSVQTVADKAQLVMLCGTAVALAEQPAPPDQLASAPA
jgi:uncharacterized protein YbjQ (UPF0145 family)